uniref:Oocyte zinc finger protein XlCOF22-like n=1 Tax=Seriola lalandi dorsalis TaxID=1841481 RepID=A0A3B4Y5E3_SERLL
APPLPLSSLRLLVPPLRLLTAAMWQVARQQNVKHYGMLDDFVSLVTEAVPELLTDRQRSLLLLALRAKVCVVMEILVHVRGSKSRLTECEISSQTSETIGVQLLFDQSYDSALQALVSDFLSRIEQLFPVPDFKQAASWLDAAPGGLEDCLKDAGREDLRELLTNQSCSLGGATTTGMTSQRESDRNEKVSGLILTVFVVFIIFPQCPRPPEPRLPEPRPIRSHSCFQCNAIFRTKAELLSHQRSHRARPVYQCGQCEKEFHHLSSLTNHKQTHLDRGGFTCSRCDKVFESAKERDGHRLQHRLPDLTCTVCEQTFSSQTQLLRHLQTHSVEGAEPCYNCRFCEQSFSGNVHRCFCGRSVTQLRIHQRTHTFRSYQCDQCNKTYGSLTGLHSHRASHSAESRFLCPQCGKRFKTRDGLEGHLRTHTGERPYRCPYCPKDFTALAGLNVHVRRHTGERPYVCTVCGKGWPSGGDLQKHMRTHTGERPYVCQDCGKAFSISCHLTEHRRIHTGKRPFSCPECGKCLRRKFDLKKHMLSHSNIRPYACGYCPKSYTRKTHLNRHLLTHRTTDSEVAVVEAPDDA